MKKIISLCAVLISVCLMGGSAGPVGAPESSSLRTTGSGAGLVPVSDGSGGVTLSAAGSGTVSAAAAVGASPNANGMTISGANINLQPADATNPGAVTSVAQTFGGNKNFAAKVGVAGSFTPAYDIDIRGAAAESNIRMTESLSGSGLHGGRFRYNTGVWEMINYETDTIITNLNGSLTFNTDLVRQVTVAGGGFAIETPIDADVTIALSNLALATGGSMKVKAATGILELTQSTQAGISLNGGNVTVDSGNLNITAVGFGLGIAEGTDARQDTCTLAAGSCTITNATVTATDRIYCTSQVDGGVPGFLRISARTANTSYVVTSGSALDTSDIACLLVAAL